MQRLRQLRKERGLTQQEMADSLGVDRTTYNKYERGLSEPSIDTLRVLARFFGVSIDYLLGESDLPAYTLPFESFTVVGDPSYDLTTLTPAQKAQLHTFIDYLLSQASEDEGE